MNLWLNTYSFGSLDVKMVFDKGHIIIHVNEISFLDFVTPSDV
jgi:hypothetical protein